MRKLTFTPLNVRELKPLGWLKDELLLEAKGLFGNLNKIWPDVRDSAWIGGSQRDWERVPYWLDGYIPLAYLLDDEGMKACAAKYIDAIIEKQQEDGWICLCSEDERKNYDVWALILIAKVLTVYADCSEDDRIEGVLLRALRCFYRHLDTHTLFNWGACRWFEALIPICWLYERTGEEWLLILARRLEIQGINYKKMFQEYLDDKPQSHWSYLTHVVNLAMALKSDALMSRIHGGDPDRFAELMFSTLQKYHGAAAGHFSGDECVAGTSPVRGTELCSIVEAMYSYEILIAVGGNPKWADELERLAFNSLPAALSEDLWAHQYDQMTNQVQCSVFQEEKKPFGTNSGEAHIFGLEPHFGCCTANFGQGWPKLALSGFMRSENGLASVALVPCEASVEIDGVRVVCRLETEYPFRKQLIYKMVVEKPVTFSFSIRIPSCAEAATVDGEPVPPGAFFSITRTWTEKTVIRVELEYEPMFVKRPSGLSCLWNGPLLYSLPILARTERREYTRNGVERKYPYCDYEYYPVSSWNYGFAGEEAWYEEAPVTSHPFTWDSSPTSLIVKLAPIPWRFSDGRCAELPDSLEPLSAAVEYMLIPYGCTMLRMTEMPMLRHKKIDINM